MSIERTPPEESDQRLAAPPLRFTAIQEAPAGTLAKLVRESYAPLLAADPARWAPESGSWDAFDHSAYTVPPIGRCVFLTWHGDRLIGFGSFDPRGAPTSARIGHHCIRPAERNRGCGRLQLAELLRRLRLHGAVGIDAFTLDLPFFAAACRLYEAAGFSVVERLPWRADPSVTRLHFRKTEAAPAGSVRLSKLSPP